MHGRTNAAGAGCAGAATYRIAVGPQQGRKVFTLQTLDMLGIARTIFYRWYERFRLEGADALPDKAPLPAQI